MATGRPNRSIPSLPRLRCLESSNVDADDIKAGALVSAVAVELHEAIVSRAQRQRQEWRRARSAKTNNSDPAKFAESETPVALAEVLTPVEVSPASGSPPVLDEPVVAPRIRSASTTQRRRIPRSATVVAIELEHPYRVRVAADRVAPPAGSSVNGCGPAEWQTPAPVTVTVATTARGDVIGYMYARHQVGRSEFLAARQYQALYEIAAPMHVRSIDLGMPPSGIRGAAGNYGPADEQLRAAARLEQVHAQLGARLGTTGVDLIRDVLGYAMTIERAAEVRGEADKQSVRFWGSMFRRCLHHLAVVVGFATCATPQR